jgi:hypothetical protein
MGWRWHQICRTIEFFYRKGDENHGSGFFVHKRITPAIKGVDFVSDRMSYNTKRSMMM